MSNHFPIAKESYVRSSLYLIDGNSLVVRIRGLIEAACERGEYHVKFYDANKEMNIPIGKLLLTLGYEMESYSKDMYDIRWNDAK